MPRTSQDSLTTTTRQKAKQLVFRLWWHDKNRSNHNNDNYKSNRCLAYTNNRFKTWFFALSPNFEVFSAWNLWARLCFNNINRWRPASTNVMTRRYRINHGLMKLYASADRVSYSLVNRGISLYLHTPPYFGNLFQNAYLYNPSR